MGRLIKYENVTLNAVGPSTFDKDETRYTYIEFRDESGNIIPFSPSRPICVESNIGVSFKPDAKGDFYFANYLGDCRLLASRINGEKREVQQVIFNCIGYFMLILLSPLPIGGVRNFFLYFVSLGTYVIVPILRTLVHIYQGFGLKSALKSVGFLKPKPRSVLDKVVISLLFVAIIIFMVLLKFKW